MGSQFMDQVPIPLVFLLTLALTVSGLEVGRRLGIKRRESGGEAPGPTGSSVGATLGLLAFMLAFTFGMASDRYDRRKQLVLEDANALGTCYLRADFLPTTQQRDETKALLREYVGILASLDPNVDSLEQLLAKISRCRNIHALLWEQVISASHTLPSPLMALFAASCNEVFDIFEERVTVGSLRIPGPVWALLLLVAGFCMLAVGFQTGLEGHARSFGGFFLVITFSTVIVLIADLDNGLAGFLRIDQAPVQALNASLQTE